MAFTSSLQALMRLVQVALAFVLLVGLPIADAATCAGEELPSSIEASAAVRDSMANLNAVFSSGSHETQSPSDAQHCIHGHCHHTTPFTAGESFSRILTVGVTSVAPLHTDMVLAHVSAGLERPPKA